VREILSGNHNYLSDLERSLTTLNSYSVANTEASYLTATMQQALEQVQDYSGQLGIGLILAGSGPVGVIAGDPAGNARTQLESIISVLNGDIAGRSLFAGVTTNQAPLEDATTLINELRLAVTGQTTPEDIIAAADAWFANPAGFDALIYAGSNTPIAPFVLSDTERVSLDVRANDPALKTVLKNIALAALADDPTLGLTVLDQSEMYELTGIALQTGQDVLTDLRSRIGFTEARIETIAVRNQAEETAVEFARNQLLAADPFETATELENVQFHLQSLYSVTVRSAQLSLVNFL
jgi:flagellar hook-associated protein 3 FlgL